MKNFLPPKKLEQKTVLDLKPIQWGSEIHPSLNFELSKRGWVANGLDLDGIRIPEAQPFKIRTNGHHFVKSHLKLGQKHLDFEWSGSRMVV